MSEPFIGEIRMFGGNFAPRGWAFCNGQLLSISQNTALFSLLGTTYGGNGETTFALPDLRGRFPMHFGAGPNLSNRPLGQKSGAEKVKLIAAEMPAHTHALRGSAAASNTGSPAGAVPASGGAYNTAWDKTTVLDAEGVGSAGGGGAHGNMPPFTVVNFIIALEGIFPSRN
jgi:microcystin-dependent protein